MFDLFITWLLPDSSSLIAQTDGDDAPKDKKADKKKKKK